MSKTCSRCGVVLLVDTEVDRKYSTGAAGGFVGAGAGNRAMDYLAQKKRDMDAAGVTCAVCGRNFCSKCMLTFGKRHPASGGLACLECGGQMTHFRG
jgi:transcription elongation factor Elf1